MAETSIEWAHPPGFAGATWNPVVGCRRVSPGCEHCYAETMAGRLARMGQARYLDVVKVDDKGQPRGRWNGTFREVPEVLALPLRARKPTCYFVNSMSDLFGVGVSDEWIAAVFGVMAACPQHRFLILTKRAERLPVWFEWIAASPVSLGFGSPRPGEPVVNAARGVRWHAWHHFDNLRVYDPQQPWRWPLPNVWLGVSVESRDYLHRLDELRKAPAARRFVSFEPLLGDLGEIDLSGIDQAIFGGESGHHARPCDVAWIRSGVAQCRRQGVAPFVKQLGAHVLDADWGKWSCATRFAASQGEQEPVRVLLRSRKGGDMTEWPEDLRIREWPQLESPR